MTIRSSFRWNLRWYARSIPPPIGESEKYLIASNAEIQPAADYEIWITNQFGDRQYLIRRVVSFDYIKVISDIGYAEISFAPNSDALPYILKDNRIEIWRTIFGITKLEGVYFVRGVVQEFNSRGVELVKLICYGENYILSSPIHAYTNPNTFEDYDAELLCNTLVRMNLVEELSPYARIYPPIGSILPGFLEVPSGVSGDAPVIDGIYEVGYKELHATLLEIAQISERKGTKLFFNVTYQPDLKTFRFDVKLGLWGIDRGQNTSERIVLSMESGNVDSYISMTDSRDESQIVIIDEFEVDETEVYPATFLESDTTYLQANPFSRREVYYHHTREYETILADAGSYLRDQREEKSFEAEVRDRGGVRYGREYDVGDQIAINVGELWEDRMLIAAHVSVSESGIEKNSLGLRNV